MSIPQPALLMSLHPVLAVVGVILASILGFVLLFWLIGALFKGVGWTFSMIGRLIGHLFECVRGIVVEAVRAVGALATAALLLPMAVLNVALGRWAASRHYVRSSGEELRASGASLYLAAIGWPLRLVGLGFMIDGFEDRVVDVVARAPRAEGADLEFEGYRVEATLPPGGSGAQLFLASPTEDHVARMAAQGVQLPSRVVIKAFGLQFGSSLPQMMRENRALEAARNMGLVFEHSSEGERFYYVMPYVPGDDLGVVTRRLHEDAGPEGLEGPALDAVVGYACSLVQIIGRFHEAGVWHKDIKPSNIVANGNQLELIDLGLVTPLASAMTLTTHGTEYYRDPDLVRQAMRGVKVHEVDGVKFDLYSAGAVVYSMIEDSFPAHGNLSRFTKRCPEALAWVVRRAMADASQRYGSAGEMLTDLAKVAAAPDPFAVRPADLPSMGGAAVELDAIPDRPLPPLRRAPRASTRTTPPPLPHQRRRIEHMERVSGRQRRKEAREAHRRARAQRASERPPSSRFAVASLGAVMLMFVFLGFFVVSMSSSSPFSEPMAVATPAPSRIDVSRDDLSNRVELRSGRSEAHAEGALFASAVAPGAEAESAHGPLVVLLTERPHELLDDAERTELDTVVAALGDHLGWRVVSESSDIDFADVDEESLLAEARAAALMKSVGDTSGEDRLQAWIDAGLGPDAVLWLGFDDRHKPTRHQLIASDVENDGRLVGRGPELARLTGLLR
ncbi:serine/threonine protein kinase [Rohdeia mirabilis]